MRQIAGLITLLISLLTNISVQAQQEYVLRKSYKPKTLLRVHIGDDIRIESKSDHTAFSAIVVGLTDSTISFGDLTVLVSEISVFYIERQSFARNTLLQGVGTGLQVFALYNTAYGNLNSVIAKGWTKERAINNLLFGGVMFSVGSTLRHIYKKTKFRKCRIGKFRLTYFSY
jgi:hypothetical protein